MSQLQAIVRSGRDFRTVAYSCVRFAKLEGSDKRLGPAKIVVSASSPNNNRTDMFGLTQLLVNLRMDSSPLVVTAQGGEMQEVSQEWLA